MVSSLVIANECKLTEISLEMPDQMDFEKWEEIGRQLSLIAGVTHWAISDWLNYGEHTYGEKYAQAADVVGLTAHTLHNIQSAGGRFPPERRRRKLSFEHHKTVAYLSREEQDSLLDKAEEFGWGIKELREAMKPPKDDPDPYYRLTLEWGKHPGEHIKEQVCALALKTGGRMKSEKEVE